MLVTWSRCFHNEWGCLRTYLRLPYVRLWDSPAVAAVFPSGSFCYLYCFVEEAHGRALAHRLDLQCFFTTKSPPVKSCSGLAAARACVAFTCTQTSESIEDILLQYCYRLCSNKFVEGSWVFMFSVPTCGGQPNRISNGIKFSFDHFLIVMYISTIGNAFVYVSPVCSQHFAN